METCRSPWTVIRVAHEVATHTLPEYASPFSRHDFTLAQLFACLVAREMMKLSYRKAEALLNDTDWCARLGMAKVPDASTLCRAFETIVGLSQTNSMLDLMTTPVALATTREPSVNKSVLGSETVCLERSTRKRYCNIFEQFLEA